MTAAPPAVGAPTDRYFNRELSWLAFNRRVLEEATNPAHPLLERLRFLSISGSNIDEFFMTRVAGLKGQQLRGIEDLSTDGRTPTQQLDAIATQADALVVAQQTEWILLRAALAEKGLEVVTADQLTPREAEWLADHFREQVLPVLTPQAIDPSHPFPFIPNRGFSLVFSLERGRKRHQVIELLMIPSTLPRFIRLLGSDRSGRFIAIEAAIIAHFDQLFPGFTKVADGAFRILRDSDIEVDDEAEDLVRYFRSAIQRRRRGRVIRLEFDDDTPAEVEQLVREGTRADSALVAESGGLIGIADLAQLVETDLPALNSSLTPALPRANPEHDGNFRRIRAKDFIIHHPMKASRRWSPSCTRRRPTPMSWRSSRRSIARASSRRSSMPWLPPPKPGFRSPRWSN